MLIDMLQPTTIEGRRAPIETPHAPAFCLGLLVTGAALASLVFACATPFAAFAVTAVSMLRSPAALGVVAATWVVNQAVGFGVLGYPTDPNTILWGFAIGTGALCATMVAALAWRLLAVGRAMSLCLSLSAAYAAYEMVLFGSTVVLGGSGAFAIAVVARLGLLNAIWVIGLSVPTEAWRVLNFNNESGAKKADCQNTDMLWLSSAFTKRYERKDK